jgi:hypothetical protein
VEVERPDIARDQDTNGSITYLGEDGSFSYRFEDAAIRIDWRPTSERILFRLTNKTGSPMRILWDDAVYVDHRNVRHRVMHSGVKCSDRNESYPATVIDAGQMISDFVYPAGVAYYRSGPRGKWVQPAFLPSPMRPLSPAKVSEASDYFDKTVRVWLPVEVDAVVKEYGFSFNIERVVRS